MGERHDLAQDCARGIQSNGSLLRGIQNTLLIDLVEREIGGSGVDVQVRRQLLVGMDAIIAHLDRLAGDVEALGGDEQ